MNKLTFVDLFCGIGAFHETVTKLFPNLNADCKWAIDNNKQKEKMYKLLFPSFPEERFLCKDISNKEVIEKLTSSEEDYDWLCAGFPCQPYSRAGERKGINHFLGKCFEEMMKIVELYNKNHPNNELRILKLENVDYLARHNKERTWKEMKRRIKKLGYIFPKFYSFIDNEKKFTHLLSDNLIINPLNLTKVPLNRPRLFLIAFHKNFSPKVEEKKFMVSKIANKNDLNIYDGNWLQTVEKTEFASLQIEEEKRKILDSWNDLLSKISYLDFPHPLWLDFFFSVPNSEKGGIIPFLKKIYKCHGKEKLLKLLTEKEKLKKREIFAWKIEFARNNWFFYLKNKEIIDDWWKENKKTLRKKKTYCKLELNVKNYYLAEKFTNFLLEDRCVIQFRHSGIRINPSTYFPTLTKHSSLIIIYDKKWEKYRYLSQKEMLQIFGFSQWKEWEEKSSTTELVSALGESISINILETIIENFRPEIEKIIKDKLKLKSPFLQKINSPNNKEISFQMVKYKENYI